MSINHVNSSVMQHPIFNSSGDIIRYESKQIGMHKAQTDASLPLADKADFLQPVKEGLGKHVDILT